MSGINHSMRSDILLLKSFDESLHYVTDKSFNEKRHSVMDK